MILKSKTLRSVAQPLSSIDKLLRQQGFRPAAGEHPPMYDVVIYDSATNCSYFLRIPTNILHDHPHSGEVIVKFGTPSLESKALSTIPDEIRQAAEHKLAEVADYLASTQPRAREA
ncbi:hypothetical protein ACTID9_19425 [Brevibacillus fluminis]|uniref:hypothetical protein n=1 Tax=Brevibacillus fluminis TaxID=511487 RepID=UPI003F8A5818